MRYTVAWTGGEQDRLLEFWLAATDRKAVTRAADRIDHDLATHPDAGNRVTRRLYELRVAPLAVAYFISHADRRVDVIGVRLLTDAELE